MDKRVNMSVHDKAIRLLEGGVVEINSDWFRLLKFSDDIDVEPCSECELDSICREEHREVCSECDSISGLKCFLRLAHKEHLNKK